MTPDAAATTANAESRARIIAELNAAGFCLFPLQDGAKEPAKGCMWRDLAPGQYDASNLPGNYGVALRPGDLIIDVDPRNFHAGDRPHVRLFKDFNISSKGTFIVQTGSGGLHVYLRKSPDASVRKTLKADYRGIDFLTDGCYVVGPGSIHPDTKLPYIVLSGAPNVVEAAPEALIKALEKPAAASILEVGGEGLKQYLNDDHTVNRFREYLDKHAPIAVQGENGDNTTYRVVCYGRDLGLAPATILATLEAPGGWNSRCMPPWDDSALRAKISHVYKYAQSALGSKSPQADFDKIIHSREEIEREQQAREEREAADISWVMNKNNTPVKCFYNLLNFFKIPKGDLYKVFGFNEFTSSVEFMRPAPWHKGSMPRFPGVTDHDLKLLKAHLAVKHSFEVKQGDLDEAISVIAHNHRFHPVRDYLMGLKWDGVERLNHWLTRYGHAKDTPYVRACSRKTICAAVARALKPGCKFDHLLVLEGGQGIGKSQLCKLLGGDWYGDFPVDPHNKDTIDMLRGKWIVEMSEMEVTRRSDVNALKAFISREIDKVRLAYGRNSQEYPRQCLFIGTINPEADGAYLKDTTGNRRFWPVLLRGKVDLSGLRKVRNQIYAEAVAALRNGEALYLDNESVDTEARAEAAERHAEHPWTERVAAWLDMPMADGNLRQFVTARDVFIEAIGGTDLRLDRRAYTTIATIMTAIGWVPVVSKDAAHPSATRGYKRILAKVAGEEEIGGLL